MTLEDGDRAGPDSDGRLAVAAWARPCDQRQMRMLSGRVALSRVVVTEIDGTRRPWRHRFGRSALARVMLPRLPFESNRYTLLSEEV